MLFRSPEAVRSAITRLMIKPLTVTYLEAEQRGDKAAIDKAEADLDSAANAMAKVLQPLYDDAQKVVNESLREAGFTRPEPEQGQESED